MRAYRAIQEIAKKNGVPEESVIYEIEYAIQDAYEHAKRDNDILLLWRWKKITGKEEIPSAVDFIAYMADNIENNMF